MPNKREHLSESSAIRSPFQRVAYTLGRRLWKQYREGTPLAKPDSREWAVANLVAPIVAMANTAPMHQYSTENNIESSSYVVFTHAYHGSLKSLPMWQIQHSWSTQVYRKQWGIALKAGPLLKRLVSVCIVGSESWSKFRAFGHGRRPHRTIETMSIECHWPHQMSIRQQILEMEV